MTHRKWPPRHLGEKPHEFEGRFRCSRSAVKPPALNKQRHAGYEEELSRVAELKLLSRLSLQIGRASLAAIYKFPHLPSLAAITKPTWVSWVHKKF